MLSSVPQANTAEAADMSVNKPASSAGAEEKGRMVEEPMGSALVTSKDDFTKYPKLLDEAFDRLHSYAVRPTIIKMMDRVKRTRQKALLANRQTDVLGSDELAKERQAAFELLDALTNSGALPIEHAAMHVVIAVTHSFADSVMDSLVKKNLNPIENIERSSLILASTLLGKAAGDLVQPAQLQRLLEVGGAGMKDVLLGGEKGNATVAL